jgi:hypothetical protein
MPAHTHYLWFETKKRQEILDNKPTSCTAV